uniref:HIRA interacting protein 3 n=1 Tax=Iconisemion striatum TaxID=60296 RepID=A0A1A7XJ86_9TELE
MVSEKEKKGLRRFVTEQLRNEPDLSTLTLGILKKRYLAHVKCESLSPEAKKFMKQVVEEELLNMQENAENESDSEIKMPQSKRKRETKPKEMESEEEKESRAKKHRPRLSSSSSDSEDEEENKTTSPKPAKAKKQVQTGVNTEQQATSEDDSSDEEMKKSEQSESENNESPEKIVEKKANTPKAEERSPKTSDGKESPESDEECESGSDGKSEQRDEVNRKSSGNDNEKQINSSDSDSSSVPSSEDGKKGEAEDSKRKKKVKKDQSSQKNDDKAVVRLKRYISLCGVRRNYKKLLDSCRSARSTVAVLKKELEDLGVHGNPSIEKCKKVRMKREEAQELAELDVGNIINTEGRPTRRGMSTRLKRDPPPSTYKRALNSGSDTEEENNPVKEHRKISEWANLRGIISDDSDSD